MPVKFLISSLFLVILYPHAFNCSAFIIKDGNVILAKNFDWEIGNGLVVINPAGINKKSATASESPAYWKSVYTSITFNHFGKDQPLGGMNEVGLVVEELSSYPVEYPDNKNVSALNEFEWIQYQLDNYGSVENVVENINKLKIEKWHFGIHYIMTDSSGDAAVIEFINNKATIYRDEELPLKVLTNNNYMNLIKYYNLVKIKKDIVEGDLSSQGRFLTIASLLEEDSDHNYSNKIEWSFYILNEVKVSDTRWQIVYDTKSKMIYFKTDLNGNLQLINFNKASNNRQESLYREFYMPEYSKTFTALTAQLNYHYLERLTDEYKNFLKTESEIIKKMRNFLEKK